MTARRDFIKKGVVGAAGLLAGCAGDVDAGNERSPSDASIDTLSATAKGPVILSTWNHGLAANARAWEVLLAKGSVLDAVEQGVMVTESDLGNRSVGLGGTPDRNGHTTLDACIQDHDGRCGSVAFLEHIEHPISVARAIMEKTPHVMLVGEGAQRWALENGFTRKDVVIPEVRTAYLEWLKTSQYKPIANVENHDTIGLIAIDEQGRMAGSCTTSGMGYKIHGRVGDSPIIGAGLFVDGEIGAACSTGTGELVIRTVGSHTVVELMRHGRSPAEACEEAVRRIMKFLPNPKDYQVGFLALRKDGAYGGFAIQPGFDFALRTAEGETLVKVASAWKPA
ncbi:MAG: N(4)-(beta-N-acetylglucosaminyl)-L-asparaginase [Flavobacteriales bacterium]|nr:N(4)-(beta-N-acetylglucosaminyl)-L-asparaginase [Flavobacteriales bacterium]MBL0043250.1 N(4)-(beta-N-acetylglucosaminyl)-L-asparaginase [Flavobacteriales bacterium]